MERIINIHVEKLPEGFWLATNRIKKRETWRKKVKPDFREIFAVFELVLLLFLCVISDI